MRIKPTNRNVIVVAIVYQFFPIGLYFLTLIANPDPKPWGVAGIFLVAEFLLTLIILSWKRSAEIEVVDERELEIQLKVKSFMLNVSWAVMGLTFIAHLAVYRDMPVWVALAIICISGLVGEQWANRMYR
ncbi:MAG: hypothetical protein AB7F86_17800 [Bdellovibrionales bacterium]